MTYTCFGLAQTPSYVQLLTVAKSESIIMIRIHTKRVTGEPIAWGWDGMKELGIKDIDKPDFGDAVTFREGEIPVFWVSMSTRLFSVDF